MSEDMDEIVKRMLENGREGCAHEWIECGDGPCSECPYYNVVCTSMDIDQVFCKKCGKGKKDEC